MDIQTLPLKKYTTLRIGGKSDIFTPNSISELQQFLQINTKAVFFLGLGSNILANDLGFNGVIIRTKHLNNIHIDNTTITAESGVTLAKLSRFATTHHQGSANFLSTIPGSVGGALRMNAGCFGREMWDFVDTAETIDIHGNIHHRESKDFTIHYRNITPKYPDEYFISCTCSFDDNPLTEEILQQRYDSQPIGSANCGSVFKNPNGHFAAQLIENAGLKGYSIGGAQISTKHANFIINQKDAQSTDVKQLIAHTQHIVKQKFGVKLETEVVIL